MFRKIRFFFLFITPVELLPPNFGNILSFCVTSFFCFFVTKTHVLIFVVVVSLDFLYFMAFQILCRLAFFYEITPTDRQNEPLPGRISVNLFFFWINQVYCSDCQLKCPIQQLEGESCFLESAVHVSCMLFCLGPLTFLSKTLASITSPALKLFNLDFQSKGQKSFLRFLPENST